MFRTFLIVGVLASISLAGPPPVITPAPPPNTRGALDRTPSGPSAWDRIQDPIDRSTGRIVDDQTYEVQRMQRQQDERMGRIIPQTDFQRFQEERDRQLRIDDRTRQQRTEADVRQKAELDRREYERLQRAGFSPNISQAMADDAVLTQAKTDFDQQLQSADKARTNALSQHPENSSQIESDYQKQVDQIRGQYERARARILGSTPAPATQETRNPNVEIRNKE